jgi:hypothetical protein
MHNRILFTGGRRWPSNKRNRKDVTQTHKGFRNTYGILPPEFLAPKHAQVLADIAADFYHIFFFCRENEAPRDFIPSGSQTRVGYVPIEYTFERKGEDEPENDAILELLEDEEGDSSLPLSGYAEEYDSALRFAGNKLRKTVAKLSLPQSGPRYPERILCCGSVHFLNAAWLRSVLRSQQKCALHGQSEALKFDPLIDAVINCVPSNGLFEVHTTAYGKQFIVSDAEMHR